MPIYPDLCSNCGLNVRRVECPRCPCIYCHTLGHIVKDCPLTNPCEHCGSKEHSSKFCQARKLSKPATSSYSKSSKSSHSNNGASKSSQPRAWNQKDVPIPTGGATISSERHDDPEWFALDDSMKEVPPSPEIRFPASLRNECEIFLQEIVDDRIQIDSMHDYKAMIENYGGVSVVTSRLMEMIHKEVLFLEDRIITQNLMKELLSFQSHQTSCGRCGGYVSVLFDLRSSLWLRFYVGQSSRIVWRIYTEHLQNILHHNRTTLHYFILWVGNGNREANFLRLWSLPHWFEWDDYAKICSNLLEALFCRAFKSYHGCLTPMDEDPPSTLGWGLNIISPLHQGPVMFEMQKLKQVGLTTRSPDKQISQWNSFRAKQRIKSLKAAFEKLTSADYETILKSAIGMGAFDTLLTKERAPILMGDLGISDTVKLAGTPDASVAFVLPFDLEDSSNGTQPLPWAIRNSGFDESNVFTIMYDEKSIHDTEVQSHIRHQLHASKAKIILLCGMRDAKSVLLSGDPHTLKIRSFTYRVDYDRSENQLFVRCRTLPIKSTGLDEKHSSSICEIMKFAGIIGRVGRLHPYFLQSSSAISFIIRQRALERQGAPNMTTETLDPSIKAWLGRKGFNRDEDILKLEELSGSLTYGLLLMLQCLPRCPPEWRNNEAVTSNGDRVHHCSEDINTEEIKHTKEFCRDIIVKHRLEWDKKKGIISSTKNDSHQEEDGLSPLPTLKRTQILGGLPTHVGPNAQLKEEGSQSSGYAASHSVDQSASQASPDLEMTQDGTANSFTRRSRSAIVTVEESDLLKENFTPESYKIATSHGNEEQHEAYDMNCEQSTGKSLAQSHRPDTSDGVHSWREPTATQQSFSSRKENLIDGSVHRPEDDAMMAEIESLCHEKGIQGEELPLEQLYQGLDLTHVNIMDYDEERRKEENDFASFDLPQDRRTTLALISTMEVGKNKRTRFPTTPKSWLTEDYRNKLYTHQLPDEVTEGNLRQISVWQLKFGLPKWLDAGPSNLVHVSIETCAEGLYHPDRWAQKASQLDIGRCLALKVLGTDSQGRPFVYIPKSRGLRDVYRANTFVDMILHQRTPIEICQVPRRFVYPRKPDLRDHPELRGYLNGGYSPGTLGREGEIEGESGKGNESEDEN